MKIILVYFLILGGASNHGQDPANPVTEKAKSNAAYVHWQVDYQLRWSDFRAPKKRTRGFAIATAMCLLDYDLQAGATGYRIRVSVRFSRYESWKGNYLPDDVLAHEQLHFDICELYGRILYRELLALRQQNRLNHSNAWQIYETIYAEYDAFQDQYDESTDYSMDGPSQLQWRRTIDKRLAALKNYADYREF
jgi:hypothetical protein